MTDKIKLCVECKWHQVDSYSDHVCVYRGRISLVTGEVLTDNCYDLRQTGCGLYGNWWAPIEDKKGEGKE